LLLLALFEAQIKMRLSNIQLNMRGRGRWVMWAGYWFLAGGRSLKPGAVWFRSFAYHRGRLGLQVFK
jgi:hypothetical protein